MDTVKILSAIAAWNLSKGTQKPVDKLKFLNALIEQLDEDKPEEDLKKLAAAYLIKLMTDSACEKYGFQFDSQIEKRIYLLMKMLEIDDIISTKEKWPSSANNTGIYINMMAANAKTATGINTAENSSATIGEPNMAVLVNTTSAADGITLV